jgi:hypothetical protein
MDCIEPRRSGCLGPLGLATRLTACEEFCPSHEIYGPNLGQLPERAQVAQRPTDIGNFLGALIATGGSEPLWLHVYLRRPL